MRRKKTLRVAGGVLLLTLALAGCGKESTVNIDEGMSFIEALDYEAALQSFEKAIVNAGDLVLAYRGQGIAYMGMTDYENAISAFEKVNFADAQSFQTPTALRKKLHMFGKWTQEMEDAYNKIMSGASYGEADVNVLW